jgi:hypothetical protein
LRALHLDEGPEVIHPYLGFVVPPPSGAAERRLDLETLGFPVGGPLVRERSDDRVVLGVFGGSVAAAFAHAGGPGQVFSQVQALPGFRGRQLVVVTLAAPGYKQPQSLIALAYLLALGGKLDVVLLIDGFNDVVLAPVENVPHQVFPFFPRSWGYRVADLNLATETRALIGQIAWIAGVRAGRAKALLGSPLRRSRTVWLAWFALDRWLASELAERRMALQSEPVREQLDYVATGPRWFTPNEASLYRDLVSTWQESSFQMRALCEAYGVRFYHFLQPNQHLPGSKPMGRDERAVAVTPGHPYIRHVEEAYPLLREAGEDLRRRGVRFHDLTQIFSNVSEPVYRDDCCHLGVRGNELLARAIAGAMLQDAGE